MTVDLKADDDKVWFDNFGQISVGTTDIGESIDFWEEILGIGPWTIFRGLTLTAVHEGAEINTPFDVALAWHDERLIELIQARGNGPSPLHDSLNRTILGLHRLASLTSDIERDARLAESRGMIRMTAGEAGGQRFIHYRSDRAPGLILELLERTPAFEGLLSQLKERARHFSARGSIEQGLRQSEPSPLSAPLPDMMTVALKDVPLHQSIMRSSYLNGPPTTGRSEFGLFRSISTKP